jgi:hypothetical protein
MMACKRTKLEEDEIAFIVAEEESDDEVQSEVSEVEDVCDTDDSVWDVIPVSVSEPDNSTDYKRNNNNCSMKDGNGNNGYSENLVSRNGLVYTMCKPKGTRRRNCNIIHTRRGLTENSQGISSLVEAFKIFFDKAIIDIIIK